MALESASQILNYRGDPNLALGGSNVQTVGVGDTSFIGQTARDLAMNNFRKNLMEYEASRQDLEAARKAIDEGNFATGDILEEHRPIVQQYKDKIWKTYQELGGNITSPANYARFKQAVNEAQDVAKQAQKKYLAVQGDLAAKAKTTNPYDHAKIDENIQKQMGKGLFANYDPYAAVVDYNLADVQPNALYGNEDIRREGNYNIKFQNLDAARTFDDYAKRWMQPQVREQLTRFANQYYTDPNFAENIKRNNAQIDAFNKKFGYTPGNPNYVAPIDANGKDRADVFAAKLRIADSLPEISKKEYAAAEIDDELKRQQMAQTERHFKQQMALAYKNAETKVGKTLAQQFQTSTGAETETLIKKLTSLGTTDEGLNKGDVYVAPEKLRKLTPQDVRMLGKKTTTEEGKEIIQEPKFTENTGLIVRADGSIELVPSTGYTFGKTGQTLTDRAQIFTNRFDEIMKGTAGKEAGLTMEGLPYLWQPPVSNTDTFVINGQSYTANELLNAPGSKWTLDGLQQAVNAGRIKKQ